MSQELIQEGGNSEFLLKKLSFDGQKYQWSDYITHFEAVSHWYGLNDSQMAEHLLISPDGDSVSMGKLAASNSPGHGNQIDK